MTIALLLLWPGSAFAHESDAGIDRPALLAAAGLCVSAVLYGGALVRRAPLRARHAVAFSAGWLATAVAVLSPLDRAAADSFAMHMVQHELLMLAAPPLLILGRPFTALAATLPAPALRLVAWPLRLPPLAALILHALALWIWHVPLLFDTALTSDGVHAVQHATFFFTALLFWWAVLRRVRTGVAILYVLTLLIHSGSLAALLTFAPRMLYAGTLLADQQLGGLIMWVPAGYALLLAGLIASNRLIEAHS
jgi:putative membrane protein